MACGSAARGVDDAWREARVGYVAQGGSGMRCEAQGRAARGESVLVECRRERIGKRNIQIFFNKMVKL